MAEGLLGGVISEEEERAELQAADTAAGAEAFASAVAAIVSRQDPGVARKTEAFLVEQARLLRVQTEHLQDEHAARLHYLQGQAREVDIRRFGLHLRVGFQLFLVLLATGIGLGVVIMIHDAVNSRSVVVESFDAPPALVARGVSGKVIASSLLDELRSLQSATRADAAKRDLANAWTGEIKLAVPETGISLDEISRVLKARFGHDLHINGEIIQTGTDDLALTVRGDAVAARTFTGGAGDLEKLTTEAAEYVYARSEPVLWAYYLTNKGRNDEAVAFSKAAFASADKADRPYLLNTWANAWSNAGGSARQALALYRAALKLKPDYWVAYNNVMQAYWELAEEENAWKAGIAMREAAGGRPGRAPETYFQNWDYLVWNLGPWLNETVADADANGGVGSNVGGVSGVTIVDINIRLHDLEAAELALQTIRPDPADQNTVALLHFLRGRLAQETGDARRAVGEMELFLSSYADPLVSSQFPGYQCWGAPVEEAAGHPERADALLASAGTFVDCYRFRADILAGRGDWAGAGRVYAEAVRLAPDLPAAYYSWGVALARQGDLTAAAAKMKDANQRGPHWADPLKTWGDILARQGRSSEALEKYTQAMQYAPNWIELKEARETLATRVSTKETKK